LVLPAGFLTVFGRRLDDVKTVGPRYGAAGPRRRPAGLGPPQRLLVLWRVLPVPMKLTSPPLMDTDEPPLRNRPAPFAMVSVLWLARLMRSPTIFRKLPPATLIPWPLTMLSVLAFSLIIASPGTLTDIFTWFTRSNPWGLDADVPSDITLLFRTINGALATSSIGSSLNAGPRELMLVSLPVKKVPACRTGWSVPSTVAGASGSVSTARFSPPAKSNIAALIVCEPEKPPLNVNSESVVAAEPCRPGAPAVVPHAMEHCTTIRRSSVHGPVATLPVTFAIGPLLTMAPLARMSMKLPNQPSPQMPSVTTLSRKVMSGAGVATVRRNRIGELAAPPLLVSRKAAAIKNPSCVEFTS